MCHEAVDSMLVVTASVEVKLCMSFWQRLKLLCSAQSNSLNLWIRIPNILCFSLVDSGALGSWEEQREFGIESAWPDESLRRHQTPVVHIRLPSRIRFNHLRGCRWESSLYSPSPVTGICSNGPGQFPQVTWQTRCCGNRIGRSRSLFL